MRQLACLPYENYIAKIGLACTLLLKNLVKNDKFIKKKIIAIFNLEILFNFSVKVMCFADVNKNTECNTKFALREGHKFVLKFQFLAKNLLNFRIN